MKVVCIYLLFLNEKNIKPVKKNAIALKNMFNIYL